MNDRDDLEKCIPGVEPQRSLGLDYLDPYKFWEINRFLIFKYN